jgi:uncharacterized protein (DUF362 family)
MKKSGNNEGVSSSRREFIKKSSIAFAGLFTIPYLKPSGIFAYDLNKKFNLSTVAITNTLNTPADNYVYDDVNGGVKQKMEYLFDQIGGISDLFGTDKKVVIKINLTGGSGSAANDKLKDATIEEAMWSHSTVVRAAAELIIDSGVSPNNIIIVESLGSYDSFDNPVYDGYTSIAKDLGCQLTDISKGNFVDVPTGDDYFNFPSFRMHELLVNNDVYVSIGKLKQHAEAGITCAIKNQVGSVPQVNYTTQQIQYRRQAIHSPTNGSSAKFLPRSICDLFAARPVDLSIGDGIKNAVGGEGVWNPSFAPSASHVLFAGKDPVATDTIAAHLMGLDPEAEKLKLPAKNSYGDRECDNYLDLLYKKGIGTNRLSEINIVGDGKDLITSVDQNKNPEKPSDFKLCANYPNPFNPSTMIVFYLPASEYIRLKVYDITGREVETIMEGEAPAGEHRLQWNATGLASGVYICRLESGNFSQSIKMLYQK